MDKRFETLPPRARNRAWHRVQRAAFAMALGAPYWWLAKRAHGHGLGMHRESAGLAFDLFRRRAPISATKLFFMASWPLDSTRYLELPFALEALSSRQIGRYLDVSSPRLLPTLILRHHPETQATLINPDEPDLSETEQLVQAMGLGARASFHPCVIDDVPLERGTVDVITSMSVIEHVPEDQAAIRHLWDLLRPGGTLILSMPCAARSYEQYVDVNHYGLLPSDQNGFSFLQRVYDRQALESRVFVTTGPPRRMLLAGERTPGFLQKNLRQKWENVTYPFWREPYIMAREFRAFDALEDLPGEGVIAMELVKPS